MLRNIYIKERGNERKKLSKEEMKSVPYHPLLSQINSMHASFIKECLESFPLSISAERVIFYENEFTKMDNLIGENQAILHREIVNYVVKYIEQFIFIENDIFYNNISSYKINLKTMEIFLFEEIANKKISSRGHDRKEDLILSHNVYSNNELIISILSHMSSGIVISELDKEKIINNQHNIINQSDIKTSITEIKELIKKENEYLINESVNLNKINDYYENKDFNNIIPVCCVGLFQDERFDDLNNEGRLFFTLQQQKRQKKDLFLEKTYYQYNIADKNLEENKEDMFFYVKMFDHISERLFSSLYVNSDNMDKTKDFILKNKNSTGLNNLNSLIANIIEDVHHKLKYSVTKKIKSYIADRNDISENNRKQLIRYAQHHNFNNIKFLRNINNFINDKSELSQTILKQIKGLNYKTVLLMCKYKENGFNEELFEKIIESEIVFNHETKRPLNSYQLQGKIAFGLKDYIYEPGFKMMVSKYIQKNILFQSEIGSYPDVMLAISSKKPSVDEKTISMLKENILKEVVRLDYSPHNKNKKLLTDHLRYLYETGINLKKIKISRFNKELNLLCFACHIDNENLFNFLLDEKIFILSEDIKDENFRNELMESIWSNEKGVFYFIKYMNKYQHYFNETKINLSENVLNTLIMNQQDLRLIDIKNRFNIKIANNNVRQLQSFLFEKANEKVINYLTDFFDLTEEDLRIVKHKKMMLYYSKNTFSESVKKYPEFLENVDLLSVFYEAIQQHRWSKEDIYNVFKDFDQQDYKKACFCETRNENLLHFMLKSNEYGLFTKTIKNFVNKEIVDINSLNKINEIKAIPLRAKNLFIKIATDCEKQKMQKATVNATIASQIKKTRI